MKLTLSTSTSYANAIELSLREVRVEDQSHALVWLNVTLDQHITNAIAKAADTYYRMGLARLFHGVWPGVDEGGWDVWI